MFELKHQRILMKIYDSASESQKDQGLQWYSLAAEKAMQVTNKRLNIQQAVGVVAALSPNNKWEQNIKDAIKLADKPSLNTKVCTFKSNRRKALKIMKSATSDIPKILHGRKIISFYNNILNYNKQECNEVTIDLWMYRMFETNPTAKNYEYLKDLIVFYARGMGYKPSDLQAILWFTVRDSYNKQRGLK